MDDGVLKEGQYLWDAYAAAIHRHQPPKRRAAMLWSLQRWSHSRHLRNDAARGDTKRDAVVVDD